MNISFGLYKIKSISIQNFFYLIYLFFFLHQGCSRCDEFDGDGKCSLHVIQSIVDSPVSTRARLSLPSSHLTLKSMPGSK